MSNIKLPSNAQILEYITDLRNKAVDFSDPPIYSSSSAISNIHNSLEYLINSNLNVLITGETGTGKELVAQALKKASKHNKFTAINCAGFNENLMSSELFGHEKGAFTGADKNKEGILAKLDGGTLFLDELGTLSHALQAQLLRAIQSHEYRKVGSNEVKKLAKGIRVIAATNEADKLRQDLKWRFEKHIQIPPLRDRISDVFILLQSMLLDSNLKDKVEWVISPQTLITLLYSSWTGNIRELKNSIDLSIARYKHHNTDKSHNGNHILFSYNPPLGISDMLDNEMWVGLLFDHLIKVSGFQYSISASNTWLAHPDSPTTQYLTSQVHNGNEKLLKSTFSIPRAIRLILMLEKTLMYPSGGKICDSDGKEIKVDVKVRINDALDNFSEQKKDILTIPSNLKHLFDCNGNKHKADPVNSLDLTEFKEEELKTLYWNQLNEKHKGHGANVEISEISGCSPTTVGIRLKKYS